MLDMIRKAFSGTKTVPMLKARRETTKLALNPDMERHPTEYHFEREETWALSDVIVHVHGKIMVIEGNRRHLLEAHVPSDIIQGESSSLYGGHTVLSFDGTNPKAQRETDSPTAACRNMFMVIQPTSGRKEPGPDYFGFKAPEVQAACGRDMSIVAVEPLGAERATALKKIAELLELVPNFQKPVAETSGCLVGHRHESRGNRGRAYRRGHRRCRRRRRRRRGGRGGGRRGWGR